MACCNGILDLEVQSFCEEIELPLTADSDGVYSVIRQNRSMAILLITFSDGDPIKIPNLYSESDIVTFQVKKPDGTIMEDANGNDCFRIKIIPYPNVYIS